VQRRRRRGGSSRGDESQRTGRASACDAAMRSCGVDAHAKGRGPAAVRSPLLLPHRRGGTQGPVTRQSISLLGACLNRQGRAAGANQRLQARADRSAAQERRHVNAPGQCRGGARALPPARCRRRRRRLPACACSPARPPGWRGPRLVAVYPDPLLDQVQVREYAVDTAADRLAVAVASLHGHRLAGPRQRPDGMLQTYSASSGLELCCSRGHSLRGGSRHAAPSLQVLRP
jgi:hypothetical protein